jgi:hypothetical protein
VPGNPYPWGASYTQARGPARASTGATGGLERDPSDSSNSATNYAWLTPRRRTHTGQRDSRPGAEPPANPAITGSGMYWQETTIGLEISMKPTKQAIENMEYVRRLLEQKQPGRVRRVFGIRRVAGGDKPWSDIAVCPA